MKSALFYRFTIREFVLAWVQQKYTSQAFYFKNNNKAYYVLAGVSHKYYPSPDYCLRSFSHVNYIEDCEILQRLIPYQIFFKETHP